MRKTLWPFFLASFLGTTYAWSDGLSAAATETRPVLPHAIVATLNREYPGWILAPVTDQIHQEFKKHKANRAPSLVSGDFDHDKKRDYAVQIVFTAPGQVDQIVTEQIVIIFLAREDAYEETIVQSMGLDRTVYLWVSNEPMTESGSNALDTLTNKDVLMVLGGPVGNTTYAYVDGRFQEVKTPEDAELSSDLTAP